jgi:hypothetical protein
MSRLLRCHRSLRTALLVLLALGLMARPMLGQLGELHGVEHAAIAETVAHGHGHVATPDAAHHHHDERGETETSDGSHDLLHMFTGVTVALPETVVQLFPLPAAGTLLPLPATPRLPGDPSSLPFRPPIA